MEVNTVIEGDCLDVMRGMPDNFVDTVITDPPYGLSFMGKNWDHGIPGAAYWRECLRVAKPGATLMAFGGTRTHHRLACAIEDAGWEIRDCVTYFHDGNQAEMSLMASLDEEQLAAYLELHYPNHQMSWVYGSGFPKSHNVSKGIDAAKGAVREVVGRSIRVGDKKSYPRNANTNGHTLTIGDNDGSNLVTAPSTPLAAKFDGWGSHGLKPAFEPIIVAIKPMGQSYAANAEAWGVAGLWIDGARIPTNGEVVEFTHSDKTSRKSGIMGKTSNSRNGSVFINTQGRYPANVILSGEPQTEAEFAKAGVRTNGHFPAKQIKHNPSSYSITGGDTGPERYLNDTGSASRYFAHCPPDTEAARLIYQAKAPPSERATPGNDHPTQKPLSLMRHLAKLTRTPDGGIVLDPFGGSGTTALACISEGRDYIVIDKEAAYVDLCRRRIAEYTGAEIAPKEVETKSEETVKQLGLW